MTLVTVELPEWDKVMKEDRIIGISLTGMMDMVNKINMSYEDLAKLLKHLKEVVRNEGTRYCTELGISVPELMTTLLSRRTFNFALCKFRNTLFSF